MASSVARHVAVRGRVQGVFFRAETRQVADTHGVTGWVANRPDGAVEGWLEGPADAVASVEEWIASGGPRTAEVTDVDARDVQPEGFERFEVR